MSNIAKQTTQSQQSNTSAAATGHALWATLSDNQQEHVSGGWPKIKWPPGSGGGGNNANGEGNGTTA